MRKNELLRLLRSGEYISGEKLGKALGISRVAVCKIIAALREDGFLIDAVPNRGYCLLRQELSQEQLAALLPETDWRFQVLRETDSTNNELKRMCDAAHGTVILTGKQTGGRGRLGRTFVSPPGGVYLSVILRPKASAGELLHLTPMTAVAVRRGIFDCCGIYADIKWTNDLIYQGKKLCGILTELTTEAGSGALQSVIIGIGINCNTDRNELPEQVRAMVVSLQEISGQSIDPNALAAAVIMRLREMDGALLTQKKLWMREYQEACITVGKEIRILRGTEQTEAFAEGIDENGGLIVRYRTGERAVVNTGEVSVRGIYGYL